MNKTRKRAAKAAPTLSSTPPASEPVVQTGRPRVVDSQTIVYPVELDDRSLEIAVPIARTAAEYRQLGVVENLISLDQFIRGELRRVSEATGHENVMPYLDSVLGGRYVQRSARYILADAASIVSDKDDAPLARPTPAMLEVGLSWAHTSSAVYALISSVFAALKQRDSELEARRADRKPA